MTKHKEEDGIFPIHAKMPCKPRQIRIERYTLPVVFDNHLEAEEAAARIIFISQQKRRWVGVSWQCLLSIMKADIAANDRRFEQNKHIKQERTSWFSFLWFKRRPKEIVVPVSGIYTYGLSFVRRGLRFLLDSQWLCQEVHHGNVVYFPTPKLIRRIMRKHNISAK